MKNRFVCIILCVVMVAGLLTGCSGVTGMGDSGKIKIVTTIFPEYDWVSRIIGDNADHVELTMLLDNGADLHSYQPTANDMIRISTCDLFIYVGGESDAWVKDALQQATNKNMVVIDLLDVLGDAVKEEEIVEGMEVEDEGEAEDEPEYDEHVWLSLKNAAVLCGAISEKLCEIDPENKDAYTANTNAYLEKLSGLDAAYQAAVDAAPHKTLLFADRFPFRYLTDDYGLSYYAAFAGCSAETEASFQTIAFLAGKVDALGLKTILQIESADGSIARAVKENTGTKDQAVITMDSMQSATSKDADAGVTYLSVMEKNLEVLLKAVQ